MGEGNNVWYRDDAPLIFREEGPENCRIIFYLKA